MRGIFRKAAFWIVSSMKRRVDSDLRERIEQVKRLTATNAAAKKDVARLEREFAVLQQRRAEMNGQIAVLELEISEESLKGESL